MPKATFLNLAQDKRSRLVEVALDEFAAHPYAEASLSRIVERAGIAKGSVYQYFEHKLDLYRWLLTDEVPRRKAEAQRRETTAAEPSDLRAWLRVQVLAGIDALLADPRLVAIIAPITQSTADPELRELYDGLRGSGHTAFVALLGPMRDAGEIREDADLELVARVIGLVLGQGLPDLVLGRIGVRLEDLAAMPLRKRAKHAAAIAGAVDETIALLLEGIAPPTAPRTRGPACTGTRRSRRA